MKQQEITKEELLSAVKIVNRYANSLKEKVVDINEIQSQSLFYDVDLPIRLRHALYEFIAKNYELSHISDFKISDLSKISLNEISRSNNFGIRTIIELFKLCKEYKVYLD